MQKAGYKNGVATAEVLEKIATAMGVAIKVEKSCAYKKLWKRE